MRVAIAGCGIAGLASAALLARAGHEVELFERFVEPQPIGSGLIIQPTGLAILGELGVSDRLLAAGTRIDRIRGEAGGRLVLAVDYAALGKGPECHGVGIHRAALFEILLDAAKAAGAVIHGGHEVRSARQAREGCWLRCSNSAEAGPFEIIVDALGTRTVLEKCGRDLAYGALWANVDLPGAGFDPTGLTQRYRRSSTMAGVLPIGHGRNCDQPRASFFWSLRGDQYEAWRANGLERWKADVLELWPATAPLLDQLTRPEQLTFARYAHRTLRHPADGRIIHIGDAWHSASPQLGQGANMALLDAFALAIALAGESDPQNAVRRAIAMRRPHVRLYQLITLLFTPIYQSDSRIIPLIRDRVMAPLSNVRPLPWLQAALVSGLIGDPLARLEAGFAPRKSAAKAELTPVETLGLPS